MCGCVQCLLFEPTVSTEEGGIGGGGDIEKSRADREITTWDRAAIEYPAPADRQADSSRRLSDANLYRKQVWMGQLQQARLD